MSFSPEELSDIECIRNVGRRYSHALDRLDADGMRAVYWPDAPTTMAPSSGGTPGTTSMWPWSPTAAGTRACTAC